MKRTIIFSVFAALLIITGCRKEDDAKIPSLIRVPQPQVTIDPASDQFISPVNPASFNGKIVVGLYFESDVPPQKMDVVVRKNSSATKVLKENLTTFPATIGFTGQELITLFGEPIKGGDLFEFSVDITTKDGLTYQAFPAVGAAYGSGIFNQQGANTVVTFLVPCAFDASKYAGDFEVLQDDWEDYKVGTVIPVKVISATQLSFQYNVDPGTAKPIILNVNPANNAITVTKQEYGSYGGSVYTAESVAGPASLVNPCNTSLSVRLKHTSPSGSSNDYTIRLRKKQ